MESHVVVGLGASAGGIRALKDFFGRVPAQSGMAYIVILHLSPEHESHLAEVIAAATPIPVTQVCARVRIAANHIYVVSPNNTLALADGHIDVAPIAGPEERRAPVDMFFRTLAEAQRSRAVSIILSGSGANGSMGLKRIKECGGLCIVQEPAEADFGDMPRNAIATGLVDYVLRVAEIPAHLAAYRSQLEHCKVSEPTDAGAQEQALIDVFALLRGRTGHDFSNYKRSTVLRRIERRINVHDLGSVADYARYLREDGDEAHFLLRDLLISVTNFFRNSEAFETLERNVIAHLFARKGPHDQVRAWVAGCATGEEAYSLAMLLLEHMAEVVNAPTVQVFATDIDSGALAKARAGLYTLNDAADVSPERLRRFFVKEGDAYRVRRELREMVLFAPHNVIKDPPFSHLDLVSCRNLLIYLNRQAQERVLRLFHFALNPGGFLFLGNSESAEESASLFIPIDKEQHIFQSRNIETPLGLAPMATSALAPVHSRLKEGDVESRLRERLSYQELHQRLLERYAPPSILITQEYDIVHLSERAGRYLQFGGGEPSSDLLKVIRPELRLELHSALYRARQDRASIESIVGPVRIEGKAETLQLIVRPVFSEIDPAHGWMLVLFEPIDAPAGEQSARAGDSESSLEPFARRLDEELARLRLQLRTTIEQHELQQEESKAANEELQAVNEELRSSSEELETSKEELQSLNEELTTINQEFKITIDELSEANNDTRNLLNATDLATVFVDRDLRIRLFTPRARSIFSLLAGDAGRPLMDITHRLRYPDLVLDIERVLETLTLIERVIDSADGRWYIGRVLPYRTLEDRIAGVVLTFTDITARKRAEDAWRASEERVRLVMESVADYAILTLDIQGKIESWNSGAQAVFGYTESEVLGKHVGIVFSPEDRAAGVPEKEMALAREQGRATDERWHLRKDGSRFFLSGVMAPLLIEDRLAGYTKIGRDLTQRQNAEDGLRTTQVLLETRVAERTRELADANVALLRESDERAQVNETRLHLLRQVVRAQEDERRRVSRELHDRLGQEVTALGLKLAALRASAEIGSATSSQLEALEGIVKQLDNDVDFLVWELRPTGLDDLGLGEALTDYVANWSRYFGVEARFESRLAQRLPAEMETVLYRIAQEALNNVAKHARASTVHLVLERRAEEISLSIQDNGVGFDAAAPLGSRTLGLIGMRERAALVAGSIAIDSNVGTGTTVTVRVPMTA